MAVVAAATVIAANAGTEIATARAGATTANSARPPKRSGSSPAPNPPHRNAATIRPNAAANRARIGRNVASRAKIATRPAAKTGVKTAGASAVKIGAMIGGLTYGAKAAEAALAAGIWGIAMYWLAGYIYTKQGVGLLRKELGEKYGA